MRPLQKGDKVLWREYLGKIKALNRTHAYIIYIDGNGGHWHRISDLKLVEEKKR
jgi:hypothetical protein